MSARLGEAIEALLAASLPAWRLAGQVTRAKDGAIEIEMNGTRARVEAPAPGLPFRYVLVAEGRSRGLMSIAALLRAVRTLADPDYPAAKVRITPYPVLPS